MRRYHAASRILAAATYSKQADLAFLLQQSQPPKRNHAIGQNSAPQKPSLSTTLAMQKLSNAVRHRKYAVAEQLFQLAPGLGTRQSALRLLVKMYCEQRDFTTAKAILYASFDKVGDRGVARYIAHCAFGSLNTSDIEEVYVRWCESHEPTPQLAAMALMGSRFLDDEAAFSRIWTKTSEFWEPSLKAPTLITRVFDLLLNENWETAFKVWRIASAMGSYGEVRPLQVFYLACRYFLVEHPNVDAVNAILQIMRRADLKLNSQFTTLLLRHLAPMFPETPVTEWIGSAQQRGWPLDGASVEVLIRTLSKQFESVPGFSHALYQHGLKALRENGIIIKRRPIAEAPSGGRDLRALQKCTTDDQVLESLHAMLSRGVQIPYYHFVVAFRLLAGWGSPKLSRLVSLIQEQGYPVHCSGIDLAVVELQCREVNYNVIVCKELVAEYLVQYPLIGHNRSQLTQLGLIMWHAGDHRTALMLVDSIRAEQSGHQRYTGANHDSASLQLALRCRLSMGEPLVPFMRSVLADRPDIMLDQQFLSNLNEMLEFRSEDKDVLKEVEQHNTNVKDRCFSTVDDLVANAHACMTAAAASSSAEMNSEQ